jgi:radical SAM protein with 4Fe4S-binding SPASM domain
MRYLTDNALFIESLEIGLATGAMPPTFLRPRIDADSRLSLEPASVLPYCGMNLLLAEHTASWSLLTTLETEIARAATDTRLADLQARYPQIDGPAIVDFFVRLYQRGLLRVDGKPGLDPTLLNDGALFHDGYLVEILVTQKCNLACRYCLAEAGPDMPHLHPELAYAAVDAAFNLSTTRPLAIQLSGGEPFINFALFKSLIQYIEEKQRQTGRAVTIVTQSNGTLIDDQIAAFVKEHQITIGISCDGPQQVNDLSRPTLGGNPSHKRTLRGMQALSRHGVRFGVIMVLSRTNVGHPQAIIDFFGELGVESVKINPINMIGDAQSTWDRMGITSEEYFDFLETFIDYVVEMKAPLGEANLREYLQHLIRRVHNYRCMRSNCGAGRSFFVIDAKGDVYPCAHSAGIPSWRLGAIREAAGDLPTLGARNVVVQQFPLRLVERIAEARCCPWRHFCEGGCAVNAYQRFGTIQAPDTLCTFYERFYPRLLERLAGEPARFQTLLDLTLGPGQASVVDIALGRD